MTRRLRWTEHASTQLGAIAEFMAAYSFFGINGYDFDTAGEEVVMTIERVAAGRVSEAKLAQWFRAGLAVLS